MLFCEIKPSYHYQCWWCCNYNHLQSFTNSNSPQISQKVLLLKWGSTKNQVKWYKNVRELSSLTFLSNTIFKGNVMCLVFYLLQSLFYNVSVKFRTFSFIFQKILSFLSALSYWVEDTHREKNTLKLDSSAYEKYEYGHLGHWYIKLTLFKRF